MRSSPVRRPQSTVPLSLRVHTFVPSLHSRVVVCIPSQSILLTSYSAIVIFLFFVALILVEMAKGRVVIVPGNGEGDIERSSWYGWLRNKLIKRNLDCVLKNMPDPVVAREEIWIPFMEKELNCDNNTVIVGHSSGAQAAMRYAEKHSVLGLVLVSACITDLGDPNEKASGYYNRPWEWEQIKQNTQWIVQFGSTDDPFLPFSEQKQVAEGTASEFHQFSDKGHFMSMAFPDLMNILMSKLEQSRDE